MENVLKKLKLTSLCTVMLLAFMGTGCGILQTEKPTKYFTPAGHLQVRRLRSTATLLKDGTVLIFGGHLDPDPRHTAEIYDPKTQRVEFAGPLHYRREDSTPVLLNDSRVLLYGGHLSNGDNPKAVETATAEIYNPQTKNFTPLSSGKPVKVLHAATLVKSGKVIITGGEGSICSSTSISSRSRGI